MDWGNNGVIAIFLRNTVYVLPEDFMPLEIYQTESPQNYISSVKWMQQTNLLAIGMNSSNVINLILDITSRC